MRYLVVVFFLFLTACSENHSSDCSWGRGRANASKPTILVVGDSISIGYTPTLKAKLPEYNVVHTPCNAMTSGWSSGWISEWVEYDDQYEAIIFNNGIWDATLKYHTSDTEYEANLRSIAQVVKARTKHPLFLLSTNIPIGSPYHLANREVELNQIAVRVMAEENVPVFDTYSLSLSISDEQYPLDVHFTPAGYEILGDAVVNELNFLYGV